MNLPHLPLMPFFPSGVCSSGSSFVYMDPSQLVRDVGAGLIGLTLNQVSAPFSLHFNEGS